MDLTLFQNLFYFDINYLLYTISTYPRLKNKKQTEINIKLRIKPKLVLNFVVNRTTFAFGRKMSHFSRKKKIKGDYPRTRAGDYKHLIARC